MADQNETTTPETTETPSAAPVMCYISKQMVPMTDTVEVQYSPGKKFRVLPRYIKYV